MATRGLCLLGRFFFFGLSLTLCVLLRFLLKRYHLCLKVCLHLEKTGFILTEWLPSVLFGADETVSKDHLNIFWAAGYYGCGCSHVGLWIFLTMAICKLFDICHYTSEADINRGRVKIPSHFGFLY